MQKLFQTTGVVLILVLSLFAQSTEPVPAPADVLLEFRTEGDQHQFHLGELILVKLSYSANIPGRYIWVSQSNKLAGGRALEISCSPSAERVSLVPPSPEFNTFAEMLHAPCGGFGGGGGGGCADCDWEQPLSKAAVSFGPMQLNTHVRLRTPGTYACTASAADVTMALPDQKIRPALLVNSNTVVLTITDDPAWAHSAATAYADAYDKVCRGDDVAEHRSLQCFDIAQRIAYLDTSESLATEVKRFDGRSHGWENGFWDAIQNTYHRNDALRLMTDRIQDPDVQVSTTVLESLAIWDLMIDSPYAFQTAQPATYHASAIETLRKYVRLLGSSLSTKNSNVLLESAKTYRTFAEQEYCERQSLISKEERNRVGSALGIRP